MGIGDALVDVVVYTEGVGKGLREELNEGEGERDVVGDKDTDTVEVYVNQLEREAKGEGDTRVEALPVIVPRTVVDNDELMEVEIVSKGDNEVVWDKDKDTVGLRVEEPHKEEILDEVGGDDALFVFVLHTERDKDGLDVELAVVERLGVAIGVLEEDTVGVSVTEPNGDMEVD